MAIRLQDTFQRANVTNGLGKATDGNTWVQTLGSNTDLSVSSFAGHFTNNPSSYDQVHLGYLQLDDCEILARMIWTSGDRIGVIARMTSSNNFIHFRIDNTNSNVLFRVQVAGVNTDYGITAFSMTNGQAYWWRFRLVGSSMFGK